MSDLVRNVMQIADAMGPAGYLVLVMGIGVLCQWLAYLLRVPSILLLLIVGFGLGQVVSPDEILGRELLFAGVTLTVGIILFEGGLSLRIRHLEGVRVSVWRLCTVTVLIAWALITITAWSIGFDLRVSLLVGAILVVTGPTVISPILRTLRPTRRVTSLLRWEGIVVDPIGAVLALLVFRGIVTGALPAVLLDLTKTLVVGFGLAAALGLPLAALMRRNAIPDFLHGVGFLAVAMTALVVANAIQPESGLLAVTVLGVYLGNQADLRLQRVSEFKEHLQILFVGTLFVILAGRVQPSDLVAAAPRAAIFVAVLVLVVRPVSIWLGLLHSPASREERTLLMFMAPRGIVAAAITSIFALEMSHAADALQQRANATGSPGGPLHDRAVTLAGLAAQADQMVPLVFITIVATVAIYGFGVGRLAERLGLASSTPQGILFAGTSPWIVQAAQGLKEAGIHTLVIDRNYRELAAARMAGVPTVTANVLSQYAVEDMDLPGLGNFIADTGDDEANATAARELAHVFGRAHVFQLVREDSNGRAPSARRDPARHLVAQHAFVPPVSRTALAERMDAGLSVRRVTLSDEFTLDHFQTRYGDQAVIMFVIDDGKIQVAHEDRPLPESDTTLIALVPARTEVPADQ